MSKNLERNKQLKAEIINHLSIHSMKKITLIFLLIATVSLAQNIKTGAENFEKYLPLLKGKSVGIVTNQTSIVDQKTHLVDFLLSNQNKAE